MGIAQRSYVAGDFEKTTASLKMVWEISGKSTRSRENVGRQIDLCVEDSASSFGTEPMTDFLGVKFAAMAGIAKELNPSRAKETVVEACRAIDREADKLIVQGSNAEAAVLWEVAGLTMQSLERDLIPTGTTFNSKILLNAAAGAYNKAAQEEQTKGNHLQEAEYIAREAVVAVVAGLDPKNIERRLHPFSDLVQHSEIPNYHVTKDDVEAALVRSQRRVDRLDGHLNFLSDDRVYERLDRMVGKEV